MREKLFILLYLGMLSLLIFANRAIMQADILIKELKKNNEMESTNTIILREPMQLTSGQKIHDNPELMEGGAK